MGCYVNPEDQDKAIWLDMNGLVTDKPCEISEEFLPVCLIYNGPFTAAGIGYDQREVNAFAMYDGRRKVWYKVPRAKLYDVSPLKEYEELG